jgi:FkbM family methyltransferase
MFSLKNWLRGSRLKCAAVTPVGPGHAQRARECRASIEAAWREHPGPFSGLEFHFIDDGRGELGRSRARNAGVAAARQAGADWIFFLDADDLMTPRAFSIFGEYADRFDAVWGLMAIKPPDSADYHVRFPQALTLRSVDELLLLDPFMTLLMGHFVRTGVAVELPFDETLDAGEDFDYYIRAWEKYRCTKVAQVLSVNRSDQHSSGPRAATADQWRVSASARLAAALESRNLQRDSDRAVAAVNRCTQEAQAFNRARHDAGADSLRLLAGRLPYRGPVEVTDCVGGKFALFTDNDDLVALSIAWTGEYWPVASRLWQVLAAEAQLILDVSAYTGYFGLLAARAAATADIVCLEPVAANFARLEMNLALNHAHNVRAMRTAAAGADAAMTLRVPIDSGVLPLHATLHDDGRPFLRCEHIEAVSIDSVVAGRARSGASLVRIAAEGIAGDIVAGMVQTIRAASPDLLFSSIDAGHVLRLDAELRQQGYRFYLVDESDSSIVANQPMVPAAEAGRISGWATRRSPDDVARIIAAAYCNAGKTAAC